MSIQSSGEYEARGLRLLNEQKAQEALRVFEEGARRFPGDTELRMGTAVARLRLGEYAPAAATLEELRREKPGSDEVLLALAECHLARGLVALAVHAAEEAIKHGGRDEKLAYRFARAFYFRRRFKEALPLYERCAELAPGWSEAWFGLGACHWAMSQVASAEAALRRAVSLAPKDWQARQFLGCVLHDVGRKDEALEMLSSIPLDAAEWQRPALERLVALAWWPTDPQKRALMESLWRRVTGDSPPTGALDVLAELSRRMEEP